MVKNKKSECSLVFYMGSAFIEGHILDLASKNKARVLFTARRSIKIDKTFKSDRFLEKSNETLKEVCEEIKAFNWFKENQLEIKNIHIGFSLPWYDSKVKEISFRSDEDFEASMEMVDESISQSALEFLDESVGNNENEELLMEKKNMQILLNGYPVEDIRGRKVDNLKIEAFYSVLSKKAHDIFTETLYKFFNEREVYFHSSSFSSFATLREIFEEKERFLILNIEGEITEINLVSEGVIKKSLSFGVGSNSFAREFAKEEDIEIKEAVSKIDIYAKNQTEEKESKKIEKGLEKSREKWTKKASQKMEELAEIAHVPDALYLVGKDALLNMLTSVVKDKELYKHTVFERPFEVYKVNRKFFVKHLSFEGKKVSSSSALLLVYLKTCGYLDF